MEGITEDQFYLASRANISVAESNELADFEREAYLNLVIKDLREQAENTKNQMAQMGKTKTKG